MGGVKSKGNSEWISGGGRGEKGGGCGASGVEWGGVSGQGE